MLNELRYNSTRVNVRFNAPRVHVHLRNPLAADGRHSNLAPRGRDDGSINNHTYTNGGSTRCSTAWGLFWTIFQTIAALQASIPTDLTPTPPLNHILHPHDSPKKPGITIID